MRSAITSARLTDPDAGLKDALQNLVFDKVGATGLLMKPDGSATATAATDIEVITDCGGSCAGKSMTDLVDVRVIFGIGQTLVDTNVPFDLGLDGVPLRLVGSRSSLGDVELRRRPRAQPGHRPVHRGEEAHRLQPPRQ